jgi:hypothetical protein
VVHILHFRNSAQVPVAACSLIGPRVTIWLRMFTLRLLQMIRVPICQRPVPRVALKSLALMAHLLHSSVRELLHLENLGGRNLLLVVLHRGNLRRRRLTLNALLWRPLCAVVHFPPLILIGPYGKLCTLSLSRKVSLILPNV